MPLTIAPVVKHNLDFVLRRALWLVGFSDDRQNKVRRAKNLSRFRAHYNGTPAVYADLWNRLQTTAIDEARIEIKVRIGPEKTFDYFLMTIHMLACYPTEEEAEATFAHSVGVCDRTWRNWCWDYFIPKIAALKPEVIIWPESWDNPDNPASNGKQTIFTFTVDGKHCPIQEPTCDSFEESRTYYSHKYNGAGLDYEIAISIFTQQCIWASGPYKAGKNDLSVFRHKLKDRVLQAREETGVKIRGIADRGYRGERDILSVPSSNDEEVVRDFKGRALSRHENFNGRIFNFDVMSETFRSKGNKKWDGKTTGFVEKHGLCFDAVVVIVQLQLENGSPLFEV